MERSVSHDAVDCKVPFYFSKRYLVVLLAFLGFVNLYTMRVNLSVAIVAIENNQEFDWSSKERGFALGAFFYGYITTQFIGGFVASKFGGSLIFGLGILGTSLMTLITPIVCYQGIYYLYGVRIIEGIFGGLSFPSINTVYAKWIPPFEKSRMSSFGISGCFAGTVIAMLLSGWLGEQFGWESIFYVFGAVGLIWSLVWFFIVRESPELDERLNENERVFIIKSLENRRQVNVLRPPWKAMLLSKPVMAIATAHFAYTWGYYTLLTELPSYAKNILGYDLQNSGFVSAIPYLALSILLPVSGYLADLFQLKNYLSVTQVRKYFINISFFAQMIFLLLAAYFDTAVPIIICLTLSVGLGAFSISCILANPLDIAPQFSSIIIGFSNTFATLPGIVSPLATGFIVTTPSNNEYKAVFFIASGIYLIGIFVYGIFATGKLQVWAVKPADPPSEASASKI